MSPYKLIPNASLCVIVCMLFVPALCFSQQDSSFKVVGVSPKAGTTELFQLQVGAFRVRQNAERAFALLEAASLRPVYEEYGELTRVMIAGVYADNVSFYLEKLKSLGFSEVMIRRDSDSNGAGNVPAGTVTLPSVSQTEIGYRSVKTGETKNIADLAAGRTITQWSSSDPATVSVTSDGDITGLRIGSAYVQINDTEYIAVVSVPAETFFIVPESMTVMVPEGISAEADPIGNMSEYRTEPTFRLAFRFNNKGESKGASGENGGIDIIARGENYEWVWTTFFQGGWYYDLNGTKRDMIDGCQKDRDNGVELTVQPEFVYDAGVPYLQLRHKLHNPGAAAVYNQRFGASADVMIHANDYAPLIHTPYGVYMADAETEPSLELMFICEAGNGIVPVDTLWLGTWSDGAHVEHIYDDSRTNVTDADSALCFSYQNITLEAGETKEFVTRFTVARTED